jgi:hypothetical protein
MNLRSWDEPVPPVVTLAQAIDGFYGRSVTNRPVPANSTM